MHKSICKIESSFRDVLEAINNEPAGIAFIVNNENKLCGVVTDGDFRRLLLAGKTLNEKFSADYLGDYIFANEGEDLQSLLKRTNKKVRVVPIVNKNNEPVDYFRYEHKTHFTPVAEPSLSSKELEYLNDAFLSTWISSKGKYIDRFEAEFASFCGVKYGVAAANGTVAIHLALVALGIKEGDEVIIPDLTFAATINAVLYTGATPVIVDVDRERWTILPEAIKNAITSKTKAIIPVHVYGQPCDMDPIMELASKHNLFVIEDCAEAHGAKYKGRVVGSFGIVSTYSFFANKIITTGEGGMCVTDSPELDRKMRILRDHGMNPDKRYWHDVIGFNYRMTNLQAAIGCAQLERVDEIMESRQQLENKYKREFEGLNIKWQSEFTGSEKVVWLVSATVTDKRDLFLQKLKEKMIDCRPFFYPLSEMDVYRKYVHSNANSLLVSAVGLNLPTINEVDVKAVAGVFRQVYC